MKQKTIPLVFIFLICAVGVGYFFTNSQQYQSKNTISLYGNVDIRQIQPAFQESGRVEKIYVHEGEMVKTGTLLAKIDDVRFQAGLKKAQAELAAQQQMVKRLLSGARPQEIAKLSADVRAGEAKFADSEITLQRMQRLAKKKVTSRQQVDDATASYEVTKEGVEAARQALDLALAGPREEEISIARAQLQAAEAGVALAEKNLQDTKLYAPADAVVRDKIMEPGDMAFPNTPVLTLARINPLWVRVYVPEQELGRIAPGMTANITTDSYPGKTYDGWIGYISPTAEFTPKTVETEALRTRLVYQARIYVCNPENELRLGMPATIHIDLTQEKSGNAGQDHDNPPCQDR